MNSRLVKQLKDQLASKQHHLKAGTCKDFTDYKVMCAELNVLEYVIDEIVKAEDEEFEE